jgi:hypothetical protein
MSVLTQNQDVAEAYCGGRSLRSILERAAQECEFTNQNENYQKSVNVCLVFSLYHLNNALYLILFGFVLRAVVFMAKMFLRWLRELQKCDIGHSLTAQLP